jgi:hypothetical protein
MNDTREIAGMVDVSRREFESIRYRLRKRPGFVKSKVITRYTCQGLRLAEF